MKVYLLTGPHADLIGRDVEFTYSVGGILQTCPPKDLWIGIRPLSETMVHKYRQFFVDETGKVGFFYYVGQFPQEDFQ